MDTAPLICLHKGARQLAQAAVWMGGKKKSLDFPVKCIFKRTQGLPAKSSSNFSLQAFCSVTSSVASKFS